MIKRKCMWCKKGELTEDMTFRNKKGEWEALHSHCFLEALYKLKKVIGDV